MAMLAVSRAVAAGDPLADVLDHIAEAATSVIDGASATSVVLISGGGSGYRLAGSHGLSDDYRQAVGASPEMLVHGASVQAIRSREVVWFANAEEDHREPGWRDLARAEGYRSLLAVPLNTAHTTVGALCVYRTLPGAWSADEVDLLRFFAEHAASAVQTAQLLAEQGEQVAALQRLVRTLQEQTHEHANRIHAVRGLLALGEFEDATRFLKELQAAHDVVRSEICARITHPTLAGLLTAVSAIAAQRDIRLEIHPESHVARLPPTLSDSQLVTIVGNLLDNAFEAVADMPSERRVVRIRVSDADPAMRIEVRDLGNGLDAPVERLLEHGVTTKTGHVGAGLALLREVAAAAMGDLDVRSHEHGTSFTVVIPNARAGSPA
jgi:LytS/YehU family sensor histidine kinase